MSNENIKNQLGYELKRAQHLLRIKMDDALKELKLTTPQYAVLATMEKEPGISNANLARASFVTPQTMHGIVATLEKNQLLKRTPDPEHGRILRAELTKHGKNIVKQAHTCIKEAEAAMVKNIKISDQKLLLALLNQCTENLT